MLVAAATATGFFSGNTPAFVTQAGEPVSALAEPAAGTIAGWDLALWAVALVVVVLLVVVPYLRWLAHTYTITTRRIVEQHGLLRRERRELTHARGYTISERRGPLQRLRGAGTLVLSNGVDAPLVLRNVPSVRLVHETLADQVEISQILAHRDSHSIPTVADAS